MHQTFDAVLGINLLHANQAGADHNRAHFDQWGITCINIMSSPGAGKTVLLERTLAALNQELKIAVIEGDMTALLAARVICDTMGHLVVSGQLPRKEKPHYIHPEAQPELVKEWTR